MSISMLRYVHDVYLILLGNSYADRV
jgi:hypothetical protein